MEDLLGLEQERLTSVYLKRLFKCGKTFAKWEARQRGSVALLIHDPSALDLFLAHFVQESFAAGTPFYVVKHCILLLQLRHRHIKGHLTRTWDCLKGWEIKKKWRPRTPYTLDLINVVFLTSLELGMLSVGETRYLYPLVGATLRLAFFGLLRPAEFLAAKVMDIKFFETSQGLVTILAIRNPKTRAWLGRAQFCTVRHGPTGRWLRWLIDERDPSEMLWPKAPQLFRNMSKNILAKAGLTDSHLTLASCRPGGATQYFIEGTPVEHLQFMGRWRGPNSLKAYIQEAMSMVVWHSLPPALSAVIESRLRSSAQLLAGPPPVPRSIVLARNGAPLPRRCIAP